MDILLISISAPPKNSPESLQTGRYLKYLSLRHKIDLLTTDITGGWEPEDPTLRKYLANVNSISLPSLSPRLVSLTRRVCPSSFFPDEAAAFLWQFKRATKRIRREPALVLSRSVPYSSAVMGMKMANFWNKPWVMHLSDLWVDSPFFNWSASMRKRHEQMELECFERAQVITLTSHKTIAHYRIKYPKLAHKFDFLPNVFDRDDVNDQPMQEADKLRFVFTGRLYGSRSIKKFLKCVEEVFKMRPDLHDKAEFVFAGFFDIENMQCIKRCQLQNVRYIGPLDLHNAIALQRSAHVLVLIDSIEDDNRYDLFFPSKLLDYLAANRTIIALTKYGSTSYEVIEGKIGKCFDTANLEQLTAHITKTIEEFALGKRLSLTAAVDNSQYEASFNAARLESIFTTAIHSYGENCT